MHVGAHLRPRRAIPAQRVFDYEISLAQMFLVVKWCFHATPIYLPPRAIAILTSFSTPEQFRRRNPHAPGATCATHEHRVFQLASIVQRHHRPTTSSASNCHFPPHSHTPAIRQNTRNATAAPIATSGRLTSNASAIPKIQPPSGPGPVGSGCDLTFGSGSLGIELVI